MISKKSLIKQILIRDAYGFTSVIGGFMKIINDKLRKRGYEIKYEFEKNRLVEDNIEHHVELFDEFLDKLIDLIPKSDDEILTFVNINAE